MFLSQDSTTTFKYKNKCENCLYDTEFHKLIIHLIFHSSQVSFQSFMFSQQSINTGKILSIII